MAAPNQANKARLVQMGCPDQVADQALRNLPQGASPDHIEALAAYAPDKSKVNWPSLPGLLQALASGNLVNIIASIQAFIGPAQGGTTAAGQFQQQPPQGGQPPQGQQSQPPQGQQQTQPGQQQGSQQQGQGQQAKGGRQQP